MKYDVAVIGLGGMGSAILAQLAARGANAIGFEQYQPAHDLGSSHGRARMIRKAYFENPAYVPLLRRSYDLWRELEKITGEEIFNVSGVLSIGDAASAIITGTQRAAVEHDLPLVNLSRREVETRYPGVNVLAEEIGILEEDAGVLDPECAVNAQLKVADLHGAEMRFGITMTRWEATDFGFEVLFSDGTRVAAHTLILALGPWFKETLESLGVPIRIQRNVQVWFDSTRNGYRAPNFPAFLVDRRGLPAPLYGFPDFGHGVKVAFHGSGAETTAQEIDRTIDHARDIEPLMRSLEAWMPGAAQSLRHATACMYTMSPDEDFVIDRAPEHPNLIVCGGFSGHGFKFAPVVGEIAAELALNGGTQHDIDFLSLRRFKNGQT